MLLGLVLSSISIIAPGGIMVGPLHWLPVFLGTILLIVGAQALLLGSLAAYRSPLTPGSLRRRLMVLGRPGAVNELLGGFCLCVAGGLVVDAVLLGLWLSGLSGSSLIG